MNEWMSLSPLGPMVLQAGLKFLYEQATAALKRKLEPRADTPQAPVQLPPVFHDDSGPLAFHLDKVEALEEPLRKLSQMASKWASGAVPVNPANNELMMATAELRLAMEHVFQKRLTFKGEVRSPEGILGQPLSSIGELLNDVPLLKPLGLGQGAGLNTGLLNLKLL